MASAFQRSSRPHWYAKIRGLHQVDPKHTVMRVPASRIRNPKTAKQDAAAFADECERYCRILEGSFDQADVAHAGRLGAISSDQGDALRRGLAVPARGKQTDTLTIRAAALSHPSSARDATGKQLEYLRYLDQFMALAGVSELHLVTIDQVLDWIKAMRKQGLSWDTRRHHLLYLRRAFVMGRRKNIPDQLAGLKLDHRGDDRPVVRTWSLDRLVREILTTSDLRRRAVLVMGGLLGMRPSEIVRADIPDLVGDLLAVGVRLRKNDPSRRTLPVPPTALAWITPAIGKRKTGALIQSLGRRYIPEHISIGALNQMMASLLREIDDPIATKDLRKTFATWAEELIPAADLERYLGHATALHAPVTDRHYLARHQAEKLRPAAAILEAAISATAAKLVTRSGDKAASR